MRRICLADSDRCEITTVREHSRGRADNGLRILTGSARAIFVQVEHFFFIFQNKIGFGGQVIPAEYC